MDIVSGVLDYVLNELGSTVTLSILMGLLAIGAGMKAQKAISQAVMFGVGFSAMSLVIGYMTESISPAAEAMTANIGKSFNIVDGGWPLLALITWTWRYAFILFPIQIAINAIMFAAGLTKTINVDLWNVWGKVFQALVVHAITGSLAIALATAGVRVVLELILGDALQPRIEAKTGIPGITCPHGLLLHMATIYPIDLVLRRIPALGSTRFDAEFLRSKIGIFAENHIMGFILGVVFGLVGRYSFAQALILGFASATALTLLPITTGLFGDAVTPISEQCKVFMEKHTKGRQVFIGLDVPILLGASEIWAASMVCVPFTLLWAVALPWNGILPFAGIVNYGLGLAAYYVCDGNLLRMILLMAGVSTPIFLWCGNAMAPMVSELALANGFIESGMISYASIDAPLFMYSTSFITQAAQGNFLPVLGLAYFLFGFVLMIRDLRAHAADEVAVAAGPAAAEPIAADEQTGA